jgi:addiction module RelE/StbE family toxin
MVKISKSALADLKSIYLYISRDSIHYAREVILTITEHIKTIESFPYKGRVVPEIQDENIREIFVHSYRIIYRVRDNIEVAAVIHAKRDFSEAYASP